MPSLLLLSVFSWSAVAWADDGASGASRTLTSPLQVAAYVNELRISAGTVLVVADGAEAEKVATTAASAMPPGTVRLIRLDGATDVSSQKALSAAGLKCGVRVGPASGGTYPGVSFGDCKPAPVAALPTPAPAAASTPATATTPAVTPAPAATPAATKPTTPIAQGAPAATTPPALSQGAPTTASKPAVIGQGTPSAVVAGAPTNERSLASPIQVAAYVNDVRLAVNGPVLLAAAGADAERVAQKVAEAMPPGQTRVVRIGYLGNEQDEVTRALASSSLRCAVRIGTTSAATFTVARFGECAPQSGTTAAVANVPASPAPVQSPSAPTPTGVASIPGVGTVLGTPSVPTPVAATPVGPPPPPPPPDPAVLEGTYQQVSLRRVKNPNPLDNPPDPDWAVRDGRGRTLTAVEFASRVGDSAAKARLERDGKTAKTLSISLAAGGGALTVAGLGVLLARESGAPDWDDFDVDPTNYDTNDAYFEAKAQAEADYKAAQRAHRIQADDRVWIAGFLTGSGLLAMGTSAFAGRGVTDRQKQSALYWTPDQADALIRAHNASLRQSLGLPPELEPVKAVVVPKPAPVEEEEEEPSEDPPEDATDPAGPAGSLLPEHPELSIHPVVGVAWLGVAGSF